MVKTTLTFRFYMWVMKKCLIVHTYNAVLTNERLHCASVEFPVHFCLLNIVTLAVVTLPHVAAVWTCDNRYFIHTKHKKFHVHQCQAPNTFEI